MAWTTPATWTTNQTVTAANLNEQIRDNENYLKTQMDIGDRCQSIDTVTADTTLTGSTSENTLYIFSVTGGTLSTANMVRLRIYGVYTETTGAQTDTIRIKYGATTMISFTLVNNAAAQSFILEVMLKGNGTTGSQRATALMSLSAANVNAGGTGTATEDSTLAKSLAVTYQSTNSSASCVLYAATCEAMTAV